MYLVIINIPAMASSATFACCLTKSSLALTLTRAADSFSDISLDPSVRFSSFPFGILTIAADSFSDISLDLSFRSSFPFDILTIAADSFSDISTDPSFRSSFSFDLFSFSPFSSTSDEPPFMMHVVGKGVDAISSGSCSLITEQSSTSSAQATAFEVTSGE
jgi:hypothetical protein